MKCSRKIIFTVICLSYFTFSSIAAPNITVDKTTYNCGTVIEGEKDKISATFTIKNTGDLPLIITSVRPGCGCTVVEHDTLILPGKSGSIKPQINLSGFTGKISKSVTVTSNAENNPTIKLIITAEIQPIIDISKKYLYFSLSENDINKEIYFSSLKKDLLITGVSFRPTDGIVGAECQTEKPISLKYKWNSLDSTRNDGFSVFKLLLINPETEINFNCYNGIFIFQTNHSDKNELRINGRIDK